MPDESGSPHRGDFKQKNKKSSISSLNIGSMFYTSESRGFQDHTYLHRVILDSVIWYRVIFNRTLKVKARYIIIKRYNIIKGYNNRLANTYRKTAWLMRSRFIAHDHDSSLEAYCPAMRRWEHFVIAIMLFKFCCM